MTIGVFITGAVATLWVAGVVFALALCRIAAKADRHLERMERERREDEGC
jgi:hypothetical protein